jgi:hypothetical protein
MSLNTKETSIYEKLFTLGDVKFSPERNLWIAVVGQAAVDAASTSAWVRADVGDWLDSPDFEIVLGNAGMEVEFVRPILERVYNTKNRKAAFRAAMTFKFMLRNYIEGYTGDKDEGVGDVTF